MPLQLRAADQKKVIWKNPKPNSSRTTKILKSQWTTETIDFVVEMHNSLEEEIKGLHPFQMTIDNVVLNVNFLVKNCMNDGKVIYAVSTEFYKKKNSFLKTQKASLFKHVTCVEEPKKNLHPTFMKRKKAFQNSNSWDLLRCTAQKTRENVS